MAKIIEMDEDAWRAWVNSRPPVIQKLCAELPPDRLYRIKPSGHRATMVSYCEDGTVTVAVTGRYNAVLFERNVFGIKPSDLEECEVPSDDEILSSAIGGE